MVYRGIRWLIILVFSLSMGHFLWRAFGPADSPTHFIGGEVSALQSPTSGNLHFYLRRTFFLPRRPQHAWIEVLSRDKMSIYLNGVRIDGAKMSNYSVGALADITSALVPGKNVIAIVASRTSKASEPVVAVKCQYELDGMQHSIASDGLWKCNSYFDRNNDWWFAKEFNDGNWKYARQTTAYLRSTISQPPRAITRPRTARWITPRNMGSTSCCIRRELQIKGNPRLAWVRVVAPCSYQLVVNGTRVDKRQENLSIETPMSPEARVYDVTALVRRGKNVLAFFLDSSQPPPRLLVDGEVETKRGQRYSFGTDGQWMSCSSQATAWSSLNKTLDSNWSNCVVETGVLGNSPFLVSQQMVDFDLSIGFIVKRSIQQCFLMGIVAALTVIACQVVAHTVTKSTAEISLSRAENMACLACVPSTLLLLFAILVSYDPRIANQSVYNPILLIVAISIVPAQWLLLPLIMNCRVPLATGFRYTNRKQKWIFVALAALVVIGFAIRIPGIYSEPLSADEIEVYSGVQGFLERGYPSGVVHEDLPIVYPATSELLFFINGLSGLVFESDRWLARFPAVCWGTMTILLVYFLGRRFFCPWTGLVAAAIYTFAPDYILMSNFARYLSQLQFFTLLTIYFYLCTIDGSGPINRMALWCTTASFVAMYLSWEGSGLVAFGLVLALLLSRRGSLRYVFCDPSIWLALWAVVIVVLIQYAMRGNQQSHFLAYGSGTSSLGLGPMWRYPTFDLLYYIRAASWNPDALVPLIGLIGAALLSFRQRFRRRIHEFFLILLTVGFLMCLLLPIRATRYIYHLSPIVVLLCSLFIVEIGKRLSLLMRNRHAPQSWQTYGMVISTLVLLVFVVTCNGATFKLLEMKSFRFGNAELGALHYSVYEGPIDYLNDHMRPGDIILSGQNHVIDHIYRDSKTDFWLESRLLLQAVVDDKRTLLLHRRSGTIMIANRDQLEYVFARYPRIWYIASSSMHKRMNTGDVSVLLREHMDIVCEDFSTILLFRGESHRMASQRKTQDQDLISSGFNYLP